MSEIQTISPRAQLFNETGARLFTSHQAAVELGISHGSLRLFLARHETLRPSRKIGPDFFWTEGEIADVRLAKAVTRPGRLVR